MIEFKRPSDAVGRDAEAQAKKYADTLTGRLGMSLQILIIGGEVDPKLQDEYTGKKTSVRIQSSTCASRGLANENQIKGLCATEPGAGKSNPSESERGSGQFQREPDVCAP